ARTAPHPPPASPSTRAGRDVTPDRRSTAGPSMGCTADASPGDGRSGPESSTAAQAAQMLQMLKRRRGGDPEVDQAGQLIDADPLQPMNHGEAGLERPE